MRGGLCVLFVIFSAMTASAQERGQSRLSSVLGFAALHDDMSQQGTVMALECGVEGLHLRVAVNKDDMPTNALNGIDRLNSRTVLFARASNGEQAFFGFEGEGQTNQGGFFISEFINKGDKTTRLPQFDSLGRFLTVYFSPKVTLGIASTKLATAGRADVPLAELTRDFDREQTLGAVEFSRFRSICQMAATGRLAEIKPPDCRASGGSRQNFQTSVDYSDDPFRRRFRHEYAGEVRAYGAQTRLEVSGRSREASSGRIEVRKSDGLELTYVTPMADAGDDTLELIKSLSGKDTLSTAMQADPVSLRLAMPDGTVLSAPSVTSRTVRLPEATFEKLKSNASISVTGVSKGGTVKFSESIALVGFAEAFEEMLLGLEAHKTTLEKAQACRRSGGKVHYIFSDTD